MITDELREWARDCMVDGMVLTSYPEQHIVRGTYEVLLAIADRIDKAHFDAQMDARDKGVEAVLKEPEGFGLIALPHDADDKVIHVGDALEHLGEPLRAHHLSLADDGWRVYVVDGEGHMSSSIGEMYAHRYAPTVEDVLEEMYNALDDARIPNGSEKRTYSEIISEYAKRLRLAESEDK